MAGALSAALRAGRSREALEGLYKHLTPAVMKFNDVIAVKGEGTWVWTADGRKLLDFTSGTLETMLAIASCTCIEEPASPRPVSPALCMFVVRVAVPASCCMHLWWRWMS